MLLAYPIVRSLLILRLITIAIVNAMSMIDFYCLIHNPDKCNVGFSSVIKFHPSLMART